jgi:hypothetical protein
VISPVLSFHCQLKEPVPPVTVADSVTVCPLSIVTEVGSTEIEGAESTVTDTVGEEVALASDAGVAPLVTPVSVKTTWIPVSAAEARYVAVVPVPDAPDIGPPVSYHFQLKVPVPPVTVAESVTVCPLSIVAEVG